LKKKETDTAIIKTVTIVTINMTEKTMTHKIEYLQLPPNMRLSQMISGFVAVELADIIETLPRDCSILKRSKRASRFVAARV
jgi:hypothetical protein